jgi:diamine N-acetyltransferase
MMGDERMVELKDITFENINKIIKLKSKYYQRKFVEKPVVTLSYAYAGTQVGYPGFASAIYSDGELVGIILMGRGPVGSNEPDILKQNKYVYRLWGFLIDKHFQHRGIGREALNLALNKIKDYPGGDSLPIMLECYKRNKNAMKLYESFGFYNTGSEYAKHYIFVRLPELNDK